MLIVTLQQNWQCREQERRPSEPLIGNEIQLRGVTFTQTQGDDKKGSVNCTLQEGYDVWLNGSSKISMRVRARVQAKRAGGNPTLFEEITYQGLTIISSRAPLTLSVRKFEDGKGWKPVVNLMISYFPFHTVDEKASQRVVIPDKDLGSLQK